MPPSYLVPMTESLLTKLDNGVMTLTLNRPTVFNSFNQEMGRAFQAASTKPPATTPSDAWSSREKAAPLRRPRPERSHGRFVSRLQGDRRRDVQPQHPTHLWHGKTSRGCGQWSGAGAGANIALACDFVVAKSSAKFVQAFANIGLIPDSGGTFWLLGW